MLVFVPFVNCPQRPALWTLVKTLPVGHVELTQSLLEPLGRGIEIEDIVKVCAFAWHGFLSRTVFISMLFGSYILTAR